MINDFLIQKIIDKLPFLPNEEQVNLINKISEFLFSKEQHEIFLLKGYAGTGKTSLMGGIIRALNEFKQKTILLAPTGRAAKVFSNYSEHPAFTIHKKIYRQKSATDFTFGLMDNLHKHTLFIVDEASMIHNYSSIESNFGTGNLLQDLIQFVYSGEGCRLLLLGDEAQLPPVGQAYSDAMHAITLSGFGFEIKTGYLKEVVRQGESSGILHNATLLRQKLEAEQTSICPRFDIDEYADVHRIGGEDLIEKLNDSYNAVGNENTIVITRSNKRASIFNKGIRNQVLQKEDELCSGDLLMVNKNNYFWSKEYDNLEFIANGDILEVMRVRKHYEMYNYRFADVSLRFLDYDYEIDARILLDTLHAETPAEIAEINKQLFDAVIEDYEDIGNKRERMKKIRENPFFNALQVKFSYAVTCHKAQGGQWPHVYIDLGMIKEEYDSDFYHWLYTALTRCSNEVFLINFPKQFFS